MGDSSESDLEAEEISVKKKQRGNTWSDDETRCLIEAWKKHVKMDKEIGSKLPFREKLVKALKKEGFDRTDKQVKKRLENLRNEFRKRGNCGTCNSCLYAYQEDFNQTPNYHHL